LPFGTMFLGGGDPASIKSDDVQAALSTTRSSLAAYPRADSKSMVVMYAHTWRRSAATITAQLANATAARTAQALDAVALETFSIAANLSLVHLQTGEGAPAMPEVVAAVQRQRMQAFGWLIAEADTGFAFNCSVASALFAPAASATFIATLALAVRQLSLDGLVIDLEPTETASCTEATGQEYAAFLARVRMALHPTPLRVYAEQWQFHKIETFFSFREDGRAAGKVVSGITYDGRAARAGQFNTLAALDAWAGRLRWLLGDPVDGLDSPAFLAAGLSTDSGYNSTAIAARVQRLRAADVSELHVFTDHVPAAWLEPLRRFRMNGSAVS
jgi:hypothetical protein